MNVSPLLTRGSASRAAHGMNDTLNEITAGIRELREQREATPPLREGEAQEQLPEETRPDLELPVSEPAPTPAETASETFIEPTVPVRPSPVESQSTGVAELTPEVKAAGMVESAARNFPSGAPSERRRNGDENFSPPRAPGVLKLPAVPDVSVELKAFASAMAQQQEVTLRTLRQVTELCRQQQSRIERLSEEMKSMTSRMRTQSNRM